MSLASLKTILQRLQVPCYALHVRLEAYFKMDNTRIYKDKRFRFLGVTLVAATALVLFLPEGRNAEATSEMIPDELVTAVASVIQAPKLDISRHDLYLEEDFSDLSKKTLTLKYGDSLGPLLQKNGIEPDIAYAATKAFSGVFNPRYLRAGQSFNLFFENDEFKQLTFKPNVEHTVFLNRQSDNSFKAKKVVAEFETSLVTVKSTIKNSLYLDANELGAPDKVIQQFANIYEYSVDFQRDIQPGDAFEMFFEVTRDKKGNMVRAGDLLYTSFSPRGRTMTFYLHTDERGRENFYDQTGKTAKRKLRATPVHGARLSSRFGKRRHPIKGYVKMHKGVDFAAPRGTPILAAGSGVVERANRYGGYGNYIRLRHTDGYKTAYAHMRRFARGIRPGVRVRQDQVIGYVGSTGASTGPHLHYEVLYRGRHINPRRLSQLSGRPLSKAQMPAFLERRAAIDKMRSENEVITQAPEATSEPTLSVERIDQ